MPPGPPHINPTSLNLVRLIQEVVCTQSVRDRHTDGWGWTCSHLLSHGVASTPPAPIPPLAAAQSTPHTPKLPPIRGWVGNLQGRSGLLGRCLRRPGLSLSRRMPEHRAPAGVTDRDVTAMILEVLGVPLPPPTRSISDAPQTSLMGQKFRCPEHIPNHSSNLPSGPPDRVLRSWRRDRVRGQGCWGKPRAPEPLGQVN